MKKELSVIQFLALLFLSIPAVYDPQMKYAHAGSEEKILVLDIERAAGIAISNSFELKEIMAQEEVYGLIIDESFREYFPSVTFSYLQTDEVRLRETDSRESRISVNTEFLLFDGGKRSLNYDVARLNAIVAGNDYRIALNRLLSNVRKAFLNLIQLKEATAIYRMSLDMGNMQLGFIRKEYELGDATKLEVIEIEARIREIELLLKQSVDEYESALKQFKLLLRIDWRLPVEIKGDINRDFFFISPEKIDEDEMIALALRQRKEIERGRLKSEISRRNMEIAESYCIPDISAGFNCYLSGDEFPPREKGWGVNFKITTGFFGNTAEGGAGYTESNNTNSRSYSRNASIDVLNNMQYRRNIAESRIDSAMSDDEQKFTEESIAVEVVNACRSLKNAWQMIDISSRRVELYNSQLEIERLKANMGESRRYDLVEKEIEWSRAAVALLEARIKYLVSLSSLEIATGSDPEFIINYLLGKGEYEKR